MYFQINIFFPKQEWSKFGDASNDPPGLNSATTVVSDEVFMQFVSNKEVSLLLIVLLLITSKKNTFLFFNQETTQPPEAASAPIPLIKCRFCKGDHWSAKCPHKDLLQDKMNETAAKGLFGNMNYIKDKLVSDKPKFWIENIIY